MRKRVYVRGHYRRAPRKRGGMSGTVVVLIILFIIIALAYAH